MSRQGSALCLLCVGGAVGCSSPPALEGTIHLQDAQATFVAPDPGFPYFIGPLGEATGDRFADIAVGRRVVDGPFEGEVGWEDTRGMLVLSPETGLSVLRSLDAVGDVSGDGEGDLVVDSSLLLGPLTGGIDVAGGIDLDTLAPEGRRLDSVLPMGGIHGAGALWLFWSGNATGEVARLLRFDDSVPQTMATLSAVDGLDQQLFNPGDVNGDGAADLARMTYMATAIYLGPFAGDRDLGAPDFEIDHTGPDGCHAHLPTPAGDVNGDRQDDLLFVMRSPLGTIGCPSGDVRLLSGPSSSSTLADATWVWHDVGEVHFDLSALGVGDLDGDGRDDVALTSPHTDGWGEASGRVLLFYGGPGRADWTVEDADAIIVGQPLERAGGLVTTAGDTDGDGRGDLLIGAWGEAEDEDNNWLERVYLLLGGDR